VSSGRLAPLDALRGVVIALMALDHVRGFFTPAGADPTNLDTTTPGFFAMRLVTHLCAPTFVLLMGAAAALRHERKPESSVSWLISRGVWLIALEATVVSFSWSWDPLHTYMGVLWALGASMILLAPMTWLPTRAGPGVAAALLVAGAVVPWSPELPGAKVLWVPATVELLGHPVRFSYVALPWFAVAAAGWGGARFMGWSRPARIAGVGAAMVALGGALRWLELGDPRDWGASARGDVFTAIDFLHVSKYPPSLDFVLLTVGVALLLLAGPARVGGPIGRWLQTLGRVPMFFYLVHLPLAHALGNAHAWARFGAPRIPQAEPISLALVLVAWAVLLALLTPACVAWRRLKEQHPDWGWLSYV
jgi:uncharacterized membrane protein